MKVLMTTDTVGGVWTYALELARALAPHGVRIGLATMGERPNAAQRVEAEACGNVELHGSEFRVEWMKDPWQHVDRAGEWLLELESRLRPDLVHLNGYSHAALPWDAPVLVVAHSCVMSWWRAVKGEAAPESWRSYRARVGQGLHDAELVIAPTHALLEAIQAEHGRLARTRVIPNARSDAMFTPGVKEPRILAVGRLRDEAKNLAALAEIAPSLPWPVEVAGCAADADGGAVLPNVRALGYLDTPAIAKAHARASIFAHPARYEPFGLAALEAALSGCALVLGDIPTLREVWGDAADFVAPDDREGLRAAIERLIRDPAYRMRRAAAARARAQRYSTQAFGEAYLHVYRALITSCAQEVTAYVS